MVYTYVVGFCAFHTSLFCTYVLVHMILAWADQSWNARSKCRRTRVWASMAYRTWQIEHRGEFWLTLRRATSLPRGNKRDYVSYKTLVRWRFACALRGGARGFWFIDRLGLRPRGLCTVATHARHVNHAPPSYNYNMYVYTHTIRTVGEMEGEDEEVPG